MATYEKVVEILDEYVNVDEIHPNDNFKSDLDMSSFELIGFATEVRDTFGVQLSIEAFMNNPTVEKMAQYIDSQKKED